MEADAVPPARLIEVGNADSAIWRLVATSGMTAKITYATLSHRWPSMKIFTLTCENLEEVMRGLPLNVLQQTFQDAILVARRLNIPYLWIDSLCIIQNSKADWQVQSVEMGRIYRNAICNIASARKSSEAGLFAVRDPFAISSNVRSMWEDAPSKAYSIFDLRVWKYNFSLVPIHERGWILQERLLAARVLYFGDDQLYWECSELDACESFPQGLPDERRERAFCNNFKRGLDPLSFPKEDIRTDQWLQHAVRQSWDSIVTHYMGCSLTYSEDKLIAFSGLARLFAEIHEDEYLAGIWSKELPSALTWMCRKNRRDRLGFYPEPDPMIEQVPPDTRAPSWSWASLDGDFYPARGSYHGPELVRVLEADIKPLHNDSFGQLLHGRLKINCVLFEAKFTRVGEFRDGTDERGYFKPYDSTGQFRTPVEWEDAAQQLYVKEPTFENMLHLPWVYFDREYVTSEQHIICMPVTYECNALGIHGLVLEEATGEEPEEYRRRGVFGLSTEQGRMFGLVDRPGKKLEIFLGFLKQSIITLV